ncbi:MULTISPECIES: DUF6452 family protein [unclassified Candidatus Cardinium]|uniref:DUF6452 family protein n=1 Tax=unclassified Candidatus Cardinium TaxID=2641185 RepID=UPI001FB33E82|nr:MULTISPECIES: DUF6452 family protein [unclassified Candidatus Cardinium]
MLVSFLVASSLAKYLRKAFIGLFLGLLSCKDFKNWESRYASQVNIKFEVEKGEFNPELPQNLQSLKIEKLFKENNLIAFLASDNNQLVEIKISHDSVSIPLNPNADTVSFNLASRGTKHKTMYYQTVTIRYERKASLISPEAGGLQIQYLIKEIQLHTMPNTNPIFKRFSIESAVPLQVDTKESKTHVTLYY